MLLMGVHCLKVQQKLKHLSRGTSTVQDCWNFPSKMLSGFQQAWTAAHVAYFLCTMVHDMHDIVF